MVWDFKKKSWKYGESLWKQHSLTHCGLATPQGDKELCQHWLVAWWHQAITWTDVNLSSVRSCGIHRSASSWDDLKIPIRKARLKITFLNRIQISQGPMSKKLGNFNRLPELPFLAKTFSWCLTTEQAGDKSSADMMTQFTDVCSPGLHIEC